VTNKKKIILGFHVREELPPGDVPRHGPVELHVHYFGSIFAIGPWMPVISGVLMVAVFLLLPSWVDRYNLFHLRDLFQHVRPDPSKDDDHCSRP